MNLKQVNEALNLYIRPQSFPLALKLYQSETDLPEKVKMPVRDLGYQVTLCQAIGIARHYRWTLVIGKEDQCCIGGGLAMGFIDKPPESMAFPVPAEKMLQVGKYSHLLIAPVETASFEPDIIVLYGNPAQVMRLAQAAGVTNQVVSAVASPAIGGVCCGDIVARTTLSDECQFILPSGGDRSFGGTQDHEVIFTIPHNKVDTLMKGLEDTHKTGNRYPILVDIRHQPTLPPFLAIPKSA